MSEDLSHVQPRRTFAPDWTIGYGLAVAAVMLFFCISFICYSYGNVAPEVSGLIALSYAVLVALASAVMITGGGGMAALPF